jgi:predicted dehydrogenase
MPSAKRLRLGLLGAGRRGKTHLSIIAGLADLFELVAICDVNEAGSRALAENFGAHAYTNVKDFFSRENQMDVVDIVTPPESHHLMALAAAEHGVNMLIETPLAPTRAMMDSIGAAAAKHGVTVEVAENFRRKPEAQLNRKALAAGLIGKPLRLTSFYEPIGQQGCYHSMSVFRLYAGEVEEVRAAAARFSVEPSVGYGTTYEAESRTDASLFFANGMTGSCTYLSSWLSPLRRGHPHFVTVEGGAGFITSGRRQPNSLHRLENGEQAVYGMKVETRRDGGREVPVRFYYETNPRLECPNPFAARPIDYGDDATDVIAVADALASIHRAVTTKTGPAYGIADARRDQELSIAISESARREGQPLRLPLGDETAWEREQHEKFRTRWGGDPLKNSEQLISRNFSGGSSQR